MSKQSSREDDKNNGTGDFSLDIAFESKPSSSSNNCIISHIFLFFINLIN